MFVSGNVGVSSIVEKYIDDLVFAIISGICKQSISQFILHINERRVEVNKLRYNSQLVSLDVLVHRGILLSVVYLFRCLCIFLVDALNQHICAVPLLVLEHLQTFYYHARDVLKLCCSLKVIKLLLVDEFVLG